MCKKMSHEEEGSGRISCIMAFVSLVISFGESVPVEVRKFSFSGCLHSVVNVFRDYRSSSQEPNKSLVDMNGSDIDGCARVDD